MKPEHVTPNRLSFEAHGLIRDRVSPNALDVTSKLQDAGFAGFLVGGCVRDLLLGFTPKDFDVATDATPEEVKALFRRSRLVGRRFRIAHVRYGRELIEVSTFRRAHAASADETSENETSADDRRHSDSGRILRDNVYGTLEEDAFRRDFTINALYYDPETEEVIDFVGGLDDLQDKRIRFIGDAFTRVREDPVRCLRAVRFEAKLDCRIDPEIRDCFDEAAVLLEDIPPARLFDEVQKLLLSGSAEIAWQVLSSTPLQAALFPACDPRDPIIELAMRSTDQRIRQDKPVTPAFLLAALLWQDYCARVHEFDALKPAEARVHAASDCLAEQQRIMAIPRRFTQFVREVWHLQDRLELRLARTIDRLANHARFRAAYDFLLLRAEADGDDSAIGEAADWWSRYQDVDDDERSAMTEERRANQPKKKRRRKRRRKGEAQTDATESIGD